jgi:hypothetical protein
MSELISAGMEIIDAPWTEIKEMKRSWSLALKELEHLCHLAKYYQDTTQAAVYLRNEFKEAYNKFTNEWHLFTARIVSSKRTPSWHLQHAKIWSGGTKKHAASHRES